MSYYDNGTVCQVEEHSWCSYIWLATNKNFDQKNHIRNIPNRIKQPHRFFYYIEMAESVLQRCVDLERFLVNSESFKIKLNYEFVDDNGQNWNKYVMQVSLIKHNMVS